MESVDRQMKAEWYANWVKCLFGVIYTSKYLQEFVNETFKLFVDGKSMLKPYQEHFTVTERRHIRLGGELRTCLTKCVNSRLKPHRSSVYKWIGSDECEGKCKQAFSKILALHRNFIPGTGLKLQNKMFLKNSHSTVHIPLEWAIAKMFMPKGNEDNNGPEDCDPIAIFRVMQNCDLFSNSIRNSHLEKVIEARTRLCHSADHSMTDEELESYFHHMVMLLQDASNSDGIPAEIADRIKVDIDALEKLKLCEVCVAEIDEALGIQRRTSDAEVQVFINITDEPEDVMNTIHSECVTEIYQRRNDSSGC